MNTENFGTWLVHGCGVSAICDTREGVLYWMIEMVKRGGVPVLTRWAQLGLMLLALLGAGQAQAVRHSMSLDQMTAYADNAILDAAQDGKKAVTLKFPGMNLDTVDRLTESLRARGYMIDEEMAELNPEIVKVRFLKKTAIAKLEVRQ